MTPQSAFLVVAPIVPQRELELRRLLAAMNDAPGRLKGEGCAIPFDQFEELHVARLLIVDDRTVGDNAVYGAPCPEYPLYLAFLGDVDGEAERFLEQVASRAPGGLRALFSCCEGFTDDAELLGWMKAHSVPPAASYVNWRGRTVRRIREEASLRDAIEERLRAHRAELDGLTASAVHARLRALVGDDIAAGRIRLSAEEPTPFGWRVRNLLHLVAVPLLFVVLSPILLVLAAIAALQLRRLEKSDPELCSRCDPAYAADLAAIEDHQVSNQFSAMGSLKPGIVRLLTTMAVLLAIDYAARHLYTHGRLARVRTIHFARWVFLDGRKRILFLSNYDGSLESYMDDFINKVGFGLNVVFSNGVGYPRTDWLIAGGCHDERKFKEYLRRHQMPTQVWYKAYPGLTAIDLERNVRVREGFESATLTEAAAREWVALL
jgi:hypothetical protein